MQTHRKFWTLNFPTWLSILCCNHFSQSASRIFQIKTSTLPSHIAVQSRNETKKYQELRIVCWFPKLININFELVSLGQTSIAIEFRSESCFISINYNKIWRRCSRQACVPHMQRKCVPPKKNKIKAFFRFITALSTRFKACPTVDTILNVTYLDVSISLCSLTMAFWLERQLAAERLKWIIIIVSLSNLRRESETAISRHVLCFFLGSLFCSLR